MRFSLAALEINALLLFDVLGVASIDLMNWTLVVELKFYFLMMLAVPLIRRGNRPVLFAIGLAALGYDCALQRGWPA